MTSPSRSSASVTRRPLTNVPLAERSSRIRTLPARWWTIAWRRDTDWSSSTTSAANERPTCVVPGLFVELADAAPVGQDDGVEPAVGDRPRVGDGQLPRALARADRARDAVPDDARAQLAELLARVA